MIVVEGLNFEEIWTRLFQMYVHRRAKQMDTRTWQALDVTDRPEMTPHSLFNVSFEIALSEEQAVWREMTKPNMPWAEQHFQERVSGEPLNPPPSNENWPYAQAGNAEFKNGEQFSHTYPERFWPKNAGMELDAGAVPHQGIRFAYGDLYDVVDLLARDPHTRQAFLPVWFPEDTGAHHRQRVPCTLGYFFQNMGGNLNIVYYIRSCDYRRHLRDDVYLAGRLAQWMSAELYFRGVEITPGWLTMHIANLHVFAGDLPLMDGEYNARLRSAY